MYGTRVIIAEDTLRLAQVEVEVRELDLITCVGKTEPVRIYELRSWFGKLDPTDAELREEFAGGLAAYRARDWDEAGHRFEECPKLKPGDGPSAVFSKRVGMLRANPPPPDWDGVRHFTHK